MLFPSPGEMSTTVLPSALEAARSMPWEAMPLKRPRLQVGDENDSLAEKLFLRVVGFDAGHDLAHLSGIYGELVETIGAGDFLAFFDLRHPEVHLLEVVESDVIRVRPSSFLFSSLL